MHLARSVPKVWEKLLKKWPTSRRARKLPEMVTFQGTPKATARDLFEAGKPFRSCTPLAKKKQLHCSTDLWASQVTRVQISGCQVSTFFKAYWRKVASNCSISTAFESTKQHTMFPDSGSVFCFSPEPGEGGGTAVGPHLGQGQDTVGQVQNSLRWFLALSCCDFTLVQYQTWAGDGRGIGWEASALLTLGELVITFLNDSWISCFS